MRVPRRIGCWVLTLALAYVAAFVAMRYGYLAGDPQAHPTARSAYAKVFYPLRRLVIPRPAPAEKFEVGTIRDRSDKAVVLDFLDSSWTAAFECDPPACAAVQALPLGREISLQLAWELADDDRFRRRLLQARLCTPQDAACNTSRQQQTAELNRLHQELNAEKEKFLACDARMSADMAALGFGDANTASERHAAAPAKPGELDSQDMQDCMRRLDERFADLAFQSCTRHGCGDGVGGGCWHITPDFVSMRSFSICRAALAAFPSPPHR